MFALCSPVSNRYFPVASPSDAAVVGSSTQNGAGSSLFSAAPAGLGSTRSGGRVGLRKHESARKPLQSGMTACAPRPGARQASNVCAVAVTSGLFSRGANIAAQ